MLVPQIGGGIRVEYCGKVVHKKRVVMTESLPCFFVRFVRFPFHQRRTPRLRQLLQTARGRKRDWKRVI
jgi:hypothetical protein